MLGTCYSIGRGVEQDEVQAVEWYRKAAEQGLADAQNTMGLHYIDGIGVEKDPEQAEEWFRRAAENGSEAARLNLNSRQAGSRGGNSVSASAASAQVASVSGMSGAANTLSSLAGKSYSSGAMTLTFTGNGFTLSLSGNRIDGGNYSFDPATGKGLLDHSGMGGQVPFTLRGDRISADYGDMGQQTFVLVK
jgi:TPR repeat protein